MVKSEEQEGSLRRHNLVVREGKLWCAKRGGKSAALRPSTPVFDFQKKAPHVRLDPADLWRVDHLVESAAGGVTFDRVRFDFARANSQIRQLGGQWRGGSVDRGEEAESESEEAESEWASEAGMFEHPGAYAAEATAAAYASDPEPKPSHTILQLTELQVEDFLYSLVLARERRTTPIVRLSDNRYAVLRAEPEESNYSTQGGWSTVTAHLDQISGSSSSVLRMQCNCSEYKACSASLGGKSKRATARLCTCCLMVVAAEILTSPIEKLQSGQGAWSLAAQRLQPQAVRVPPGDGASPRDDDDQGIREQDALVEEMLAPEAARFPEEWPREYRQRLEKATRQVEEAVSEGRCSHEGEDGLFPSLLRPLHACPSCIDPDGSPRALCSWGGRANNVWVFIGKTVRRQQRVLHYCNALAHPKGIPRTAYPGLGAEGVGWTTATGLFNVSNAWFFSVLLLDDATNLIRENKTTPTEACRSVLMKTWRFMADAGAVGEGAAAGGLTYVSPEGAAYRAIMPDMETSTLKMYAAWYAYEIVLTSVDLDRYSLCRYCGLFPSVAGSDADAKVAFRLSQPKGSQQLDYTPQDGKPLWTQQHLFAHCHRALLHSIMWGGNHRDQSPIPVDSVPPIFFSKDLASDVVFNTEAEKRSALRRDMEGGDSGVPRPSTECLSNVARAVSEGHLNPTTLRFGGYHEGNRLTKLLERCGCPPKDMAKLKTDAGKRLWLLRAYDTMHSGESHCHMFTSAARGTGGTCSMVCPHRVNLGYKHIFTHETNRDHVDIERSLICPPCIVFQDDSCGKMTFYEGAYPEEFKQLYGPNRGCPKPWKADFEKEYLTPVMIPELDPAHIRYVAQKDPTTRRLAKQIVKARGKLRLSRHPFLKDHRWRLCLTDGFHQRPGGKTHKKKACQLHLEKGVRCRHRDHYKSNMMESLNAHNNKRLATICTADPHHAFLFYHRVGYWENKKIIQEQEKQLARTLAPGMTIAIDPIFRTAEQVRRRHRSKQVACKHGPPRKPSEVLRKEQLKARRRERLKAKCSPLGAEERPKPPQVPPPQPPPMQPPPRSSFIPSDKSQAASEAASGATSKKRCPTQDSDDGGSGSSQVASLGATAEAVIDCTAEPAAPTRPGPGPNLAAAMAAAAQLARSGQAPGARVQQPGSSAPGIDGRNGDRSDPNRTFSNLGKRPAASHRCERCDGQDCGGVANPELCIHFKKPRDQDDGRQLRLEDLVMTDLVDLRRRGFKGATYDDYVAWVCEAGNHLGANELRVLAPLKLRRIVVVQLQGHRWVQMDEYGDVAHPLLLLKRIHAGQYEHYVWMSPNGVVRTELDVTKINECYSPVENEGEGDCLLHAINQAFSRTTASCNVRAQQLREEIAKEMTRRRGDIFARGGSGGSEGLQAQLGASGAGASGSSARCGSSGVADGSASGGARGGECGGARGSRSGGTSGRTKHGGGGAQQQAGPGVVLVYQDHATSAVTLTTEETERLKKRRQNGFLNDSLVDYWLLFIKDCLRRDCPEVSGLCHPLSCATRCAELWRALRC